MNPILKKQFDTVKNQLKELETVLEKNQAEVQKQHDEKSELLQKEWSNRKRLTTLERIEVDFESVAADNDRYRDERVEIRENLNSIVELSKALHRMQKP
jgi:hypothetical protein